MFRTQHVAAIFVIAMSTLSGLGCEADVEDEDLSSAEDDADEEVDSTSSALSGANIKCTAVNDFGYVGTAQGKLTVSGPRDQYGHLKLKGRLKVTVGMFDQPKTKYSKAKVHGTVDPTGQYANLVVDSGAAKLESMNLYFGSSYSSSLNGKDGIQYQTSCSALKSLPQAADLRPDGTISLLRNPDGTVLARIGVANIGTKPVSGTAKVLIGNVSRMATVVAAPPNSGPILPGFAGTLEATFPSLSRCTTYSVTIDTDKKLQSGAPSPFKDDKVNAKTTCLEFNTPITTETLGLVAGTNPDPLIAGKTIDDIINSRVIARADGNVCSRCHHSAATSNDYHPAVAFNQTSSMTKNTYVSDPRANNHYAARTWAGEPGLAGWAQLFALRTNNADPGYKPPHLRNLFQRWIDDGAR